MDYESQLKLSYYNEIASINPEHGITVVQHIQTKKIFVKKILSTYNLSIYQNLMNSPIAGVPKIYGLYEDHGTLTVIEEYILGSTVAELLEKDGAMSERQALSILLSLCDILTALHNRKPPIIHRDIKPSNVMLNSDGKVYLLDLNAARADIAKEEDTKLLGTQGYAAPEQYGFGSSSIQTDIYALGMLMNTMLWGEYRKELFPSKKLLPILKGCTQLNPKDRFQTVPQVKRALSKGNKTTEQPIEDWKKYLPPGFRTGNKSNMVLALLGYASAFGISCTLEIKDTFGSVLIFERFMCLLMFLSAIACAFNYLGIQKLMPLCKKESPVLRYVGIVILVILDLVFFFMVMILGEYFFLP